MEQTTGKASHIKAVIFATLGNIIWGFGFLFTKVGLSAVSDPNIMLSHRFLISTLVMLLMMLVGKQRISFKGKNWKPIALLLAMQLSYYMFESYAILYTNSTVAGLVLAVVPVVTIATGALFLKVYPTKRQALFCILPVAGVIIISVSGKELGMSEPILGILFLLLTMLSSAIYKTANRKAAVEFTPFERTFTVLSASAVVFTVIALRSCGWSMKEFVAPFRQPSYTASVLALSVLGSIVANLLVNYAMSRMSVFKVSSFGSLSTLCAGVAGILFLHEPLTVSLVVGGVLILVGIRIITQPADGRRSAKKGSRLKTFSCRAFQAALKLGNYFMGYRMPKYLEGAGAISRLGAFLREKKLNDVLVVTGSGMVRRGQVQPLLDGFEREGIRYTVKAFERTDPTTDDVEEGYRAFREAGCKTIVALGGGSRIDCAKGIAAKAAHPKRPVAKLQGLLKVLRPVPTLIAIPTTAGAGSETTVAAVITDPATHRKASINDPFLIPKYAVLDPELTASLPPYTTATTGMDALAHAVEAFTNRTYNTKLENKLALEAVQLICEALPLAFENGSDLQARQKMQLGAFYAGRAFTRGCVGYVHAIGHTLGGLYGVAHGEAMAALLPKVMTAYGSAVYERLARLAEACAMEGSTDEEKAKAFIAWLESMNEKMGIPTHFPQIREEDIPQMAAWADKEANPLYPVPVIWTKTDLESFIANMK